MVMVIGMKAVLGHADNFVFGHAGEHRSYEYMTPLP